MQCNSTTAGRERELRVRGDWASAKCVRVLYYLWLRYITYIIRTFPDFWANDPDGYHAAQYVEATGAPRPAKQTKRSQS
jgi:hypothetical protein